MGGEKPKSDQPEAREDYEATVIDFLDQEITASAKSTNDQDTASEELDALVLNLLKEVITASDAQDSSPATGGEDFDTLSTGHQSLPDLAVLQPEKRPDAATKGPETIAVAGRAPALAFSPSRPAPSKRGLIISVALVCLLASIGFGIYRLTSKQLAPTAPLKTGPDAQMQSSQHSKPETQPPVAQPIGVAAEGRGTSAVLGSGKPSPRAAPLKAAAPAPAQSSRDSRKETKNSPVAPSSPGDVKLDVQAVSSKPTGETTQSREVSTAPSPTAAAVPPAAPAEKPAPPTASAAESPAGTRQPEKVDNATSVPTVPATSEPKSAQPGPGAASSNPHPVAAPVPSVVSPPVAISKVSPIYPEAARRMRITGTVILDLSIDADGKVTQANLVSGESVLAYAAMDAVKKWRYKPASINGKSVPGAARVSIVFNNP